ncbi:hypothetical protein [Oceanihabitans sediminis]|uniref:hypothetical protein n=1 Tax=Oceanihabitans sediminis TaxID=1812012 RepID=UPI00299DF962|nr:hypothetical protein [Oceanihabitans sediminis]MDX1279514.1 hypothetical protein [Oceanihabitans sediminis]
MKEGIIFKFKAKDDNARVLLNHTLFGRLDYRNYRGKKYAYYVQGMLDNTKFFRLGNGKVFIQIKEITDDQLELLKIFGYFTAKETTTDAENINDAELKTGHEYWADRAKEKELPLRVRKNVKR